LEPENFKAFADGHPSTTPKGLQKLHPTANNFINFAGCTGYGGGVRLISVSSVYVLREEEM
jgi:hypothetical protein